MVDIVKEKSKSTIFKLASGTQALKEAQTVAENPPKKVKELSKEKP